MIRSYTVYEAFCDVCEADRPQAAEHFEADEAYDDALSAGWTPIKGDEEGLRCPACALGRARRSLALARECGQLLISAIGFRRALWAHRLLRAVRRIARP